MPGRLASGSRRRIAWALLIGLMITIGLSWLAMFVPRSAQRYGPAVTTTLGVVRSADGQRIFTIEEGSNAWHRVVRYWHMQISGMSISISADDMAAQQADFDAIPSHLRPARVDDLKLMAWYREVGFPFPALTCSIHWQRQISNSDILYTVNGGVQLPRDADFTPRALPLTPLWLGMGANTLVWSVPAWLIMWAIGALREARRRRANCCGHCGYPRTGLPIDSPCPECGRRAE